ncbi:MAG TPA: HAMP domain-containing sensor histidine kinase [Gemmatimonadales bacterium]|nr:HAMP domain-containing sensor histidine kinase [Gemmatimonadales bacterium]
MLAETFRQGAGEILRQASVALGGRPVTLWEVAEGPALIPQATSDPQPRHHFTAIDIDSTLRRWGVPIRRGTKWVGCRLSHDGPWVIAPVRSRPPAPPPGGHERRSAERLTIELAGLCIGLVDRRDLVGRPSGATLHEPLYDFLTLPAVIAHEAKNPLAAARAGLQLSMDTVRNLPGLTEQRRRELIGELGEVFEALDRALDFLQAVQDRARGTKAGPTRFDAVRVARSVVALEGRVLRQRGVDLELVTSLEAVHLNGDPGLLYELVLNLVRNAAEATLVRPGPIAVHLDCENDRLRIAVQDRGVGIPPHLLEKVFEPGFSTKDEGEGLGAGLAIVRKVAQTEFDGAVSVTSTVGAGTTFTVTLPIPPQRGSQPSVVQPEA